MYIYIHSYREDRDQVVRSDARAECARCTFPMHACMHVRACTQTIGGHQHLHARTATPWGAHAVVHIPIHPYTCASMPIHLCVHENMYVYMHILARRRTHAMVAHAPDSG